ncbi:hypothetical protein BH23PLA1_BH23PLA1_08720 [soil metagenome]
MTERHRPNESEWSPEQRAKIEAFRASRRTPEARAEEQAVREAIRAEFPPAEADAETLAMLASLRQERERQGLSLADMAERTGIDSATLSRLETGRQPNPTISTLKRYAAALGRRIEIALQSS